MKRPLIGITVDNVNSSLASGKYKSNVAYSRSVAEAGGIPLLLPQEVALAEYYVDLCDGLMLTGGDDILPEPFGVERHPEARCMEPQRQAFELALLDAIAKREQRPLLGICMGMQLMAMHAGGKMVQHLPDTIPNAVMEHQNDHRHPVIFRVAKSMILPAEEKEADLSAQDFSRDTIYSSHHQAVVDAGRLRVIAAAPDGVIEAIDDPSRPYCVGVQWHPERGAGKFNFDLIKRFVAVCAVNRS